MANDRELSPARIRAFVALRLGSATIEAISAMVAKVRLPGADVAWIRPANFHLTLRFLGDQVSAERLEPLKAALGEVARETVPFAIAARGIGAFPDWRGARVVWVGLEATELMTLAARVEATAVSAGFERERRPFTAHLTVGRVRGHRGWRQTQRALKEWREHDFGSSQVESMTLYRSILSPGGSQHDPLAEFRFG